MRRLCWLLSFISDAWVYLRCGHRCRRCLGGEYKWQAPFLTPAQIRRESSRQPPVKLSAPERSLYIKPAAKLKLHSVLTDSPSSHPPRDLLDELTTSTLLLRKQLTVAKTVTMFNKLRYVVRVSGRHAKSRLTQRISYSPALSLHSFLWSTP